MIVSFCFTSRPQIMSETWRALQKVAPSHKNCHICGWEGINKISGRYLHRDRPLANIYVNNQKGLFRMHIRG